MRKNTILLAKAFAIILTALFLIIKPAGEVQAIMVKMGLEELTADADSIVVGTVENVTSQWNEDNSSIYTTVVVSVEEKIKGSQAGNTITIVVPGGHVDGITQIVSDTPVFNPGEEALLFLKELPGQPFIRRQTRPRYHELSGNFQGKKDINNGKIKGVPLSELQEEIKSIIEKDGADSSLDLALSEPEYVSYNQYVYLGFRWPGPSPVVPYRVNALQARTLEVNAAARTWSNAGADFSFHYEGTHSRSGMPAYNGTNEIMWYDLGTYNALAIAAIWYSGNIILETDIIFNTLYNWSTTGNLYDVQSVALHEFGHCLGLGHSDNYGSIMYFHYRGSQHYLHQVDIAGIQAIYGSSGPAPLNDDFSARLTLGSDLIGQVTGNNINATKEIGEPNHTGNIGGRSVWWRWTAPSNGSIEVNTYSSNFDTLLAVYVGNALSSLTPIAVNDDYGGTYQSRVSFNAFKGVNYSIAVDGWLGAAGSIVLNWQFVPDPCSISVPNQPIGPAGGKTGTAYEYITGTAACTNDHAIEYRFDWGDDSYSEWNSSVKASRNWDNPGTYQVKSQARCAVNTDRVSAWSPPKEVVIAVEQAQYTLTIIIKGEGTTNLPAGTHSYNDGSEVVLEAVAAEGWQFDKWVIDSDSIFNASTIINMTANITAKAVFTEIKDDQDSDQDDSDDQDSDQDDSDDQEKEPESEVKYTLSIDIVGEGITTPSGGTPHQYDENTTVEIFAFPDEGWSFDKWLIGQEEYKTDSITIAITDNITVTAVFSEIEEFTPEPNPVPPPPPAPGPSPPPTSPVPPVQSSPPSPVQYILTVAIQGEGSTDPGPGLYYLNEEAESALTAKPSAGWRFEKWVIDSKELSTINTTVNMNGNKAATAYFKRIELGDITGDGLITVADVVIVARHTLGMTSLTEAQMTNADVSGDGLVDIRDITLIMRYALGIINSFPAN